MWRAWMMGAGGAATAVLAGWGTVALVAGEGIPLVVVTALVLLTATFALARAWWATRLRPSDRQVARLIEERESDLDDVVATAVDYGARPDATPRMRQALFADAASRLRALGVSANLDRILSRESVRAAGRRALAAVGVLALAVAGFAPSISRATNVAGAYLFPARISVDVTPGSTKVRAGQSVTISARIAGFEGEMVPTLTVVVGEDARAVRMTAAEAAGMFALTIDNVTSSFAYNVSAASTRSDDYTVTVIRPPRVERIDLHYEFPEGIGLEPRTDEDSGDIYGPEGTRVRLSIAADKPIDSAALLLDDGTKVPLSSNAHVLNGALTIDHNGSYRIALVDRDGLESPGDTEYFIRTLDDRPPDVRILRPASDKHVTPLEEVHIEARADDDFGVASLELVFQTPNGQARAVPLRGGGGLTASGMHTLFLEDLKVQPGDFVTYYARARDVNRGRRSAEARSDIFFLEVKPFEEEFVAAQSQQMGAGAGMQSGGLDGLVEAQKQIIVATWNLDARARRARSNSSQQDIKAVSKAQSELRDRAEQASAQAARLSDPRRRRRFDGPAPGDDPIGKAVEAMGRAVSELDKFSTSGAMPHEMEALNHLLRAEAENRRRQVTRSQQAGGGGGQNRAEADLSSLFDQELRKRQQTNYETPNSTEARDEKKAEDDPLDRIRELARRQDALNRQQRDLSRQREQMDEDELKRQLERLTREQNELRQQAEQLAQQLQRNGQAGRSSQSGEESQRLREISEDMRNAATGMRQQDGRQASESGTRASDRLRDLERQMQATSPDDRRRALGDLQLETRQLAEQQRRLANEASRTSDGQAGDDARRRLVNEQQRLADRAERLEQQVQRLSRAGQGEDAERRATEQAARELEQQNIANRMRQSAEALRKGEASQARQQDVASALDRVADQLGAATGTQNADARSASELLGQSQQLRDTIQELDRSIQRLQRESQGQEAQRGAKGQRPQDGQRTENGRAGSTGDNDQRLAEFERDVNQKMREAERLSDQLRRENPDLQGSNDTSWVRSFSAPGTEAFKQDFSRWESLKKNLLIALEEVETKLSTELRAHETAERLNAGGHQAVSEAYRDLVDKYYRSLAAPRQRQ